MATIHHSNLGVWSLRSNYFWSRYARREVRFLLFSLGWCCQGPAQEFPTIHNSEADKQASPMPAEKAAKEFDVPDGFQVGVFASEPQIQNPIAMSWDSRGRMWIAENFTYADRTQRFDLSLRDRVLILEDTDGDGAADKRSVFTDQVQMLTSIETGFGGVWLMCPSQLLFIPDADRDDVPDGPAQVVLDGFTVAKENYHNFANGLKWGPDGWLYGRCGGSCPGKIGKPGVPDDQRIELEGGIWRYHPQTTQFEVLCHGTTNPWGHDWNEFGDAFFINTVNGHLWHLIPGAHFDRPFTLDPNPSVYELIDMHADHWHFDTKGDWMKSRDGAANSFGGGHAHSGMTIYLGDDWPNEYRGRLLTLNFHGRRANQESLSRKGSGYVATHGPDMLIASDPFFRGIEISYGPDGAGYVLDWSDTGECHERTGVHRTSGRAYRVSHESGKSKREQSGNFQLKAGQTDLRSLRDRKLVGLMQHPNVWFVRQARLILAERYAPQQKATQDQRSTYDAQALTDLRELVEASDNPVVSYRALSTLYVMGHVEQRLLIETLEHDNEHLRSWAIRLLSDHWPIDNVFGPLTISTEQTQKIEAESAALLPTLCQLAERDASGLVRLTLASTLQRLPVSKRIELASSLVQRAEDADDHNLPLLVWHGLIPVANHDTNGLAKLATMSKWPKTQALIARRLAERMEEQPVAIDALVAFAIDAKNDVRLNLLGGISDGLKGWSRATQPKRWPELVGAVENGGSQESVALVRDLSVLFGDGRALDEVRKIVLDNEAEIGIRRSALETLVKSKSPGVVDVCLSLLDDRRINAIACKGIMRSNDPSHARKLIEHYGYFAGPCRPQVIEVLVSRKSFAKELLDAIESKQIPVSDLTAFDVRQIRTMNVPELEKQVVKLWGAIRESTEEKQKQIEMLKTMLSKDVETAASPSRGRALFDKNCVQCHRLFGHGASIGPDLTGADRKNLDYLLENIVDPSAVVSKDFNMSIVLLDDGRMINGLVTNKNEKTMSIQTQTELVTVGLDEIEETKMTTKSPMPDAVLDSLSDSEIRDLFSYLQQPAQVALPKE